MNIFRTLLIEPDLANQNRLISALRFATPAGVRCSIEVVQSTHQALHLLRGYGMTRVPNLIVSYNSADQPVEPKYDACCHDDLLRGIQRAVESMNLDIPVVITGRNPASNQKGESVDRTRPMGIEMVAQEYRMYVQRKFPPTASLPKPPLLHSD